MSWEKFDAFRQGLRERVEAPRSPAKQPRRARKVTPLSDGERLSLRVAREVKSRVALKDALRRSRERAERLGLPGGVSFPGLTEAERRFLWALSKRKKGAKVERAGWPDFLVRWGGETFGVEVKAPGDRIRSSQRRMFAALEEAGIRVFVWSPGDDRFLRHWEKWT